MDRDTSLELNSRFAASILRLCRAPSLRGCMLGDYFHIGNIYFCEKNRKQVPPWRRGQAKGQGMDPPRRGGISQQRNWRK